MMKTSFLLRASLLAAALSAALSAKAVQIGLTSAGTLDLTNSPVGTVDETVLLQQGGFGVLTVLHMDFNNTLFPVLGTGIYTGAGGSLSFSYQWATATLQGGTQSLVGTWAMTGGTGTYVGLTGSGTLTTNHDISNGYPSPSFTTFRGQLEAVPEPASMAALGLGAAALLKRRKRA